MNQDFNEDLQHMIKKCIATFQRICESTKRYRQRSSKLSISAMAFLKFFYFFLKIRLFQHIASESFQLSRVNSFKKNEI